MIKPLATALVLAFGVAGCNHSVKPGSEASTITYTLPETHAKIDAVLILRSCNPLRAAADITITPLAAPSDPELNLKFTIIGSNLQSFTESRDFKVDIYPHGALKTVNATSADKTANIIGGVIKLAATIGAMAGAQDGTEPTQCNTATDTAFSRYTKLKDEVGLLRASLETAPDRKAVNEQIDALAQEIARLETGELQVKLSKVIQVARKSYYTNGKFDGELKDNGIIKWERSKFAKWVDSGQDGPIEAFSLSYCITSDISGQNTSCPKSEAEQWASAYDTIEAGMEAGKKIGKVSGVAYLPSVSPDCVSDDIRCPTTLVFRDPVPARMIVSAASDNYSSGPDSTLAKKDFGVTQWGEFTYLALSAGFGESKTISLSLDEFGRKTQFGWISNARGEGIVSGLNSIAEPISTYRTTKEGENLANMKSEIDELETTQKLNGLRKCKSVIENGGSVCPKE
jgi:hypothetical protein